MKTTMRAFLPALALLSLLTFCSPAGAGMISTPKAERESGEARGAALVLLQARLSEAGPVSPGVMEGLSSLPTSELLSLSGTLDSAQRAGYHYYLVVLGICAVGFGIFAIFYWGIFRHRHGHSDHHCE